MCYVFDQHQADRELARLRRIETALDGQSRKFLTLAGVTAKATCLEVGAGSGSILRWLGEKVGVEGCAVGMDKNTIFLKSFTGPPYEIIEKDVLAFDRPGAFDLIHCRYVLVHNRASAEILLHLKRLLKKGGRLVLEEPDFESAEWVDAQYAAACNRVNDAICAMFLQMSLDPGYGKRMPWLLSHLGLAVERVEAVSHLERGGGPVASFMADSAEALRDKYVATQKAANSDVDRYIEGARDPTSWANYYSTISVIGLLR